MTWEDSEATEALERKLRSCWNMLMFEKLLLYARVASYNALLAVLSKLFRGFLPMVPPMASLVRTPFRLRTGLSEVE